MTHKAVTAHAESSESLWYLAAPPLIWALHFLLSYVTAAVVCAKLTSDAFQGARVAIALYTLLALAGLGRLGHGGWRKHRAHRSTPSEHARDTAEGRHGFLGFALLLLCGLSALAVLYAALAALLIERCR